MNFLKDKDLKELLKTFSVMDKEGNILSTDEDELLTEEEVEEETPEEEEQAGQWAKSCFEYSIPELEIPLPHNPNAYYDGYCEQYLRFTDSNPTTYHTIEFFKSLLENNGFTYWPEYKSFDEQGISNGGLFFTIRGGTSLIAFVLGGKWSADKGVGVVGSHVDALTVNLKPNSIKSNIDGYQLLGVANYSGTLNKAWLDRDLGIAGSIIIRDEDGQTKRKLVNSSPHPVAKIPSLAEHFGDIASKPYNKETQMVPIIGHGEEIAATEDERNAPLYGKHSIALLRYISKISQVPIGRILKVDLQLFDVQKSTRGGLDNEFIFAPRIDDRLCSFSAIYALIEWLNQFYSNPNSDDKYPFKDFDGFNIVLLADNEEIGSATRTGAKGKLLNNIVDRVISFKDESNSSLLVFANLLILSADVTHALNPNFSTEYLENHKPKPNVGLTVKLDPQGHVMTELIGWRILQEIANKNHQTLQQFHIKNDARSGSTIGPMLATDTGARVVDVGLAQLSMHSIRAMAGYKEIGLGVKIFKSFFKDWREVCADFKDLV